MKFNVKILQHKAKCDEIILIDIYKYTPMPL